ncbi:MAG: gamma-glutamyltransferase [Rhizomicrobium sp.]|jgi:gamma-glutamyltranspeptidase/glutathione hydrolase
MYRFPKQVASIGLVFLTGCSWFGGGNSGPPPGGFVVGDEPYAVKAGASVLAEGGSAADAVTATYFALAATYSVAAGIGGGGICVVHDRKRGSSEAISFLARDAAGGGAFAVPGAVRGFGLLQASYGRLPWQRDVAPGEGFAATGFPISRALSVRIFASQDVIRLDASLSAEFLDESGLVKPVGSIVSNSALGATLSAIRVNGPDGFYRGPVAAGIADYSKAQGGAITDAELASYAPQRDRAAAAAIGNETAYMPPNNLGPGAFAQSLLAHLVDAQGNPIGAENLTGSVATATKETLDKFNIASLPRDLGATGFAATDNSGQSVACAVTMNGPFGSGHTAQGTGVTLAKAPSSGQAGLSAAFLTPVVATGSDGSLSLVGAGAGGPNGTAAIAYALIKLAAGEDVSKPGELHSTGIAPYDTVNVIACPDGVCSASPDPGANGLGAAAGQ